MLINKTFGKSYNVSGMSLKYSTFKASKLILTRLFSTGFPESQDF